MSARRKLFLVVLFVVMFTGLAIFAAGYFQTGSFAFINNALDLAGKVCTTGCMI